MEKKYVLLSGGGFDSAAVLTLFPEQIGCALSIDYGQKAADAEWIASTYFANKYGIPAVRWFAIDLSYAFSHPMLRRGPENRVVNGEWEKKFEGDRLESRNLLLLSHAVLFACSKDYAGVMTGFHRESTDSFPDASPGFFEKCAEAAQASTTVPVKFWAPLQERGWGRVEVLHQALKVDPEVWYAYTCYGTPQSYNSDLFKLIPCRHCVHCYRRGNTRDRLREAGYTGNLPLNQLGHVELHD